MCLLFVVLVAACGSLNESELGSEAIPEALASQQSLDDATITKLARLLKSPAANTAQRQEVPVGTPIDGTLPSDADFGDLATLCGIDDAVFGAVNLFGHLETIGFAISRSVEPSISRERDGDDPLPSAAVCLNSRPSDAIQGCGVVDWATGPTTMHAPAHEVTPTLFWRDTPFTAVPTLAFEVCPGRPAERDPVLFGPAASRDATPTPTFVSNKRIANIIDQALDQELDLRPSNSFTAAQCESLDQLTATAHEMHAAVRSLLGHDTLYPRNVAIDLNVSDDILAISDRIRELLASTDLSETSVDATITTLLLSNHSWEGIAEELTEIDQIPAELQEAWAHWQLGVQIEQVFAPDSEAAVRHLNRVHGAHCG